MDRVQIVGALLLGMLLLGFIFFDKDGIPLYLQMLQEIDQLDTHAQHLQTTNQSLRLEIDRIQQDPLKLEELARDRLGMVRPGELVYQFVEPQSSTGSR